MTRYVELGRRACPLRFTAEGILRTVERTGVPFQSLFTGGAKGVCALFYCAILPAMPHISLQGAADLMQLALKTEPSWKFVDRLLAAFADSGFPSAGVSTDEAEKLVRAATKAGMPNPQALLSLTKVEMARAIDAFEAQTARQLRLMDALAYMQGAYALRASLSPSTYPARPCMARGNMENYGNGTGDSPFQDTTMTDESMLSALAAWAERRPHGDA